MVHFNTQCLVSGGPGQALLGSLKILILSVYRRSKSSSKRKETTWDFSEVAAAGTIKNKNAGSGEMFVEDWAGSMLLCCSFLVLFLKASFMAKKNTKKKAREKNCISVRESSPKNDQPIQVMELEPNLLSIREERLT